jgi:hypothetical protein
MPAEWTSTIELLTDSAVMRIEVPQESQEFKAVQA